jgi:uncharacterized RDD family membrane protein YckC
MFRGSADFSLPIFVFDLHSGPTTLRAIDNMKAHWDEDISILSAENVSFAVETAGLGSRLAAVLLDLLFQGIAAIFVSWGLSYVVAFLPNNALGKMMASSTNAVIGVFGFLIFYSYFFFWEWLWSGQTPGKRIVGVRVLHANGLPITWWPAFLRNLLRIIDFLPFGYGVGCVVSMWGPHNQRVGDIVAGTIVARERRDANRKPIPGIGEAVDAFLASREAPVDAPPITGAQPIAVSPETLVAVSEEPSAPIDPQTAALRMKLSQEDYEFILEFLTRRATMPAAVRARLAKSLALRVATKLDQAAPPDEYSEPFLEETARIYGTK